MLKLKNQTERQKEKQIQWYLKCDRQNKQEIEYRYATGHILELKTRGIIKVETEKTYDEDGHAIETRMIYPQISM